LMNIQINRLAIDRLVNEWQNQKFPWAVYDTPLFQADAFADSMQYFFLGSVIHYRLYGINADGTPGCYRRQNAEGSIAYWRTLKAHWTTLFDYKLDFPAFERIFAGLTFLPERYHDFMETLKILKRQYSGQVNVFLESCQWDIARILDRINTEFPAFASTPDAYSERSYLFLYLAQGKFASANLFNHIDLILPYLDQILLASLIQTNVMELPAAAAALTDSDIPALRLAARRALQEILAQWNQVAARKILPADINTPLRKQGLVSIWREKIPLMFA
jgi:hypothetical protein